MVNTAHGARFARQVVIADLSPCNVRERNQDWLPNVLDVQDASVADLMKLDCGQFCAHRGFYKVA